MSLSSADQVPVFLDLDLALKQIGSEQAVVDMLVLLEESLARDIPLVSQYLSQGDAKGANQVLHAMKGVVPIFCVDALCHHVAQVESLSKAGTSGEIAVAYAPLRSELEQLLAEVAAYLGDDLAD